MDFISNSDIQNQQMLASLGIESVEELFGAIPRHLLRPRPVGNDSLSELETLRHMERLAQSNHFPSYTSYLGAGAYEHHVPAIVSAICSKSEFLTAYTPYQPEISQGMLQAIFEYQSAICALTGMDVANASVYDGAAACAEAILMAMRHRPDRRRIVVAASVHPHYRKVIEQYIGSLQALVQFVPFGADGRLDLDRLEGAVDEQTVAVLVQSPNFLGVMEPSREVFAIAARNGALSILCANPLSYGLFASAGELGADIAVGDSQPFGLPLQFGGPYVGYMATRQSLMRQLPGRIVGETEDTQGRRGFVLTLQAREQHIRREKATSNICTNQALAALASLVAILWYGPHGVRSLALTCYQRANYLRQKLGEVEGVSLLCQGPIFHEFVIGFQQPLRKVLSHFRRAYIQPGISLEDDYPKLKNGLLVAVTETKTIDQLNEYVDVVRRIVEKRA